MSVQEIALSHNQRKKLLKAITDENILFEEENGDIVMSVEGYKAFKVNKHPAPIENIIGDNLLDDNAEFIVFS